MQQGIRRGVELQLLDDSLVVCAVDVDVQHVDMRRVDSLTQVREVHLESQSLGQSVGILLFTIEIAGNDTLLTQKL